nr:MAG: ORF1 [Torque teno midi virus]
MPFWWRRRNKPWYGRRRYRRRFQRFKNRRRRRRFTKRRTRRAPRRRRKRKYKVRRKKKKITIQQWQPDSIRKCHIKGHGLLVLGAEGTQMNCYTCQKLKYVPPKVPYGGGFGIEKHTLKYLYEEYQFKNNIWTASNIHKDLCRFLYVKFTMFRHPETDFIVAYDRSPPFEINQYTYPSTHPQQMLLDKRKKVIFSLASKPQGRYSKKFLVKPPKQMITKWFFTKEFSKYPLLLLKGTAANMRYSFLTAKNQNLLVNIYSLNVTNFYINSNWGKNVQGTHGYQPYTNIQSGLQYSTLNKSGTETKHTMPQDAFNSYNGSVSYSTGWFMPPFLQAYKVYSREGAPQGVNQLLYARYNPTKDKGTGNKIYLASILADHWGPPSHDKQLLLEDFPLWLGLWGYLDYINTIKPIDYMKSSVVVLESDAIYCYPQIGGCKRYVPIDYDYIMGKKNWEQTVTTEDKARWYPTVEWQLKTLNAIAETGPFVPKYSDSTNSTWELKYHYDFCFKWGGPELPEQDVKNPTDFPVYDVPDKQPGTIQITNPEKQATETIFHPWDYRRGIIKERAIKRMCQHLETDTEFEYSTEEVPKKKRSRLGAALTNPEEETQEAKKCLLSLCKENIFQDQEQQTIENLIQQQQQQQQELKYNIVKLLIDLKNKQRMLQLQTGLLD